MGVQQYATIVPAPANAEPRVNTELVGEVLFQAVDEVTEALVVFNVKKAVLPTLAWYVDQFEGVVTRSLVMTKLGAPPRP